MNQRNLHILGVALVVLITALAVYFALGRKAAPEPAQNPAPQPLTEVQYKDLVRVTNPLPNQTVTSPFTVRGEARGMWFFEASFPVKLLDANGKVLALVPAQAEGEWMTENYVPFSATLTFSAPATSTGTLVLEKDNASGLPEFADEFRIPVTFGN